MFLRGGGISMGIRLRSYSSIVGERSSRRKGIVREIALILGIRGRGLGGRRRRRRGVSK